CAAARNAERVYCAVKEEAMNENEHELVVRVHRESIERYREEKQKVREQVEAMFRAALEREREQEQRERAAVEEAHRQAIEQARVEPLPPHEPTKGVHYTELPEAKPGQALAEEWNTYRREVGRWLAEGLEGRHVLIKGEEILGIYDTSEE